MMVSDPESEIFFLITYEISKLGSFIYCLSTKVDILLKFRMPYNQLITLNKTTHVTSTI